MRTADNILQTVFPIVFFVLLALSGTPADARQTVLVQPVSPYAMQDESGAWTGPAIDLVRSAAERSDIDITFAELNASSAEETRSPRLPSGALAIVPVYASVEQTGRYERSLPIARDSIGIIGSGQGRGFLRDLTKLFSMDFLKIALVFSVILLIFGAVFWFLERGNNPGVDGDDGENSAIKGIGNGFWWAGVTATTIGYGDTIPKTVRGRGLAMVWMLISMAVTAMLTAYLVSLTGGRSSTVEFAATISEKNVGIVETGSAMRNALTDAQSVQRYRSLDDAAAALEEDSIDLIAHPFKAAEKADLDHAVVKSDADIFLPVILVSPSAPEFRRAIDRLALTPTWQKRMDAD